jgi:hypothetical protein
MASNVTRALLEVLEERGRQRLHYGYIDAMDDTSDGRLAELACYMAHPETIEELFPADWEPDTHSYRKDKTPRQRLIVAMALLLAEIERLDRAEEAEES